MRIRKQELGNRNIVGVKVEDRRKTLGMKQIDLLTLLQVKGVELTASGLSKLEGQLRCVNDFELVALAEILGVTINWLVAPEVIPPIVIPGEEEETSEDESSEDDAE